MKTLRVWFAATVLLGVLLMLQAPRAFAQEGPPQPPQDREQPQGQPSQDQGPQQDPPGRVARLSYSVGSVSFQPGGEGDWVEAVRNRPLSSGDNFWADKDSRAELQTGSTSIRIDSQTSLTLLQLDDRMTQLKLSQGSIIVRVQHLDDEDHVEVDTPNLAFEIQRTGEYRIDVNADGNETNATVWHGRGEATGAGASFVVIAGQRARFTGTDQLDHQIYQIPKRDDFDVWAFNRDGRQDHSESANYISPEMTGAQDLDEYGHWRYLADYGPVWTPSVVAAGWAPYRYGHWVWVSPWGWTWVEDEPWGFAPFHYGRWAYVQSSWCWVPGPVYVRPVYAPALVAFVGGGGFAAGVAWFPLAPREVYVPWYRTSPAYVNNVNITNTRVNVTQVTNVYNTTIINNNTTNITRINYVNQHVTNGITAVHHDAFVNARPVAANMVKVDARQIAEAPVTHTIPVQPVRASVMGAGRPVNVRPPATVMNRPVIATRQPPAPVAPLDQRRNGMQNVRVETPGQPQSVSRVPVETPRPGQPANRADEMQRPQPPTMQANHPSRPQESPNTAGNHPVASPNAARPGNVQAPEPSRQPEFSGHPTPQSPAERSVPHPSAGAYGNPLVKPAPPVQENPRQQQSEQSKFNAWQQQRQNSASRQTAREPAPPRAVQPVHTQPMPAQPVHTQPAQVRAPQPAHEGKPHQ
jgi:FecR protein